MPVLGIMAIGNLNPIVTSGSSVRQMEGGLTNTAPVSGGAVRQAEGAQMGQTMPAYRGVGANEAERDREGSDDYQEYK